LIVDPKSRTSSKSSIGSATNLSGLRAAKVTLDEKRSKALDQLDKAPIKVFKGYPPR
jgi:hypothetical protein